MTQPVDPIFSFKEARDAGLIKVSRPIWRKEIAAGRAPPAVQISQYRLGWPLSALLAHNASLPSIERLPDRLSPEARLRAARASSATRRLKRLKRADTEPTIT
jgi:hypothetical protein